MGAIVSTALDRLEARILAQMPFNAPAYYARLLETARLESLGVKLVIQDVPSEVLRKSVVVSAPLPDCFAVSSCGPLARARYV